MSKSPPMHPLVWFLIIGTCLSRAALFITLPFLSIYISKRFGASPKLTGIIMGLGPLCGIISAFWMGYLSDKIGRKTILQVSLFLWALAFFGYIPANQLWMVAGLHMLYGTCRAGFETVATALLTDITPPELRKKVFHLRYYAINIGACIGPPLGSWLLLQKDTQGFWFTGLTYLLYFLFFLYFTNTSKAELFSVKTSTEPLDLKTVAKTLRTDHAMIFSMLGCFMMLLAFAQLETTMPQFLQAEHGKEGIKWLVFINLVNAVSIVIFQFPLARVMQSFSLLTSISTGFFIFSIGFSSFAFFTHQLYGMMFAMFILTFGEMLTFSNTNVWIDRISPKHLKGSYFGLLELTNLGFVIGPFIGGWMYEVWSAPIMFVLLGSLSLLSIVFYINADRIHTKRTVS